MRLVLPMIALLALAACETTAPTETLPAGTEPVPASPSATATSPGATVNETSQIAVAVDANHPSISDTQDFEAVKARETIASDKARLEAQREKFVEIAPAPLPKRPDSVNVAEYALQTTNAVGQRKYFRNVDQRGMPSAQACARYKLPEDAQAAFLRDGGPRQDPGNLDPDGDGFACDWTPDTYRKLVK